MRTRVRHFNPAHAGCQVALDARFLALANASAVASWPSRPGGLYGATASGTAQPTFLASSVNGQPAVQFDGTSDCMDLASGFLALPNAAAGMLIIAVAVCDNAAADATQNAVFISSGSAVSSTRMAMRAAVSNVAALSASGRRLDADSLVGTANATGATVPGVWQVYSDWTGNSLQARLNGGTAVAVAYSSGAGNCSPTNSLAAKVGGQSTSTSRLSGRIAAVVISAPLLSQPLRMMIRQSLAYSFRIPTA